MRDKSGASRAMRQTILLFDIDGTLVSTGGAGRRAMERAFIDVTGNADTLSFSFGGMTDRAIARRGLDVGLEPVADARIAELLDAYVAHLRDEVPKSAGFVVHDGVPTLLDQASAKMGYAVGLGTGNVREGARVKLSHVELFDRFAFGGFGCDHEERSEVLAVGRDRGALHLGVPATHCRVVVIGDTPRDIAAARAIGAEVLAVATGGTSSSSLQAAAPDLLVSSLADAAAARFLFS